METRVKIRTGLPRTPPFDRNGRDLLLFLPHRVRAIHPDRGSIAPLPVALGRVYRVGGRCTLEQKFPLAPIRYITIHSPAKSRARYPSHQTHTAYTTSHPLTTLNSIQHVYGYRHSANEYPRADHQGSDGEGSVQEPRRVHRRIRHRCGHVRDDVGYVDRLAKICA
jgi:hypothetical protein